MHFVAIISECQKQFGYHNKKNVYYRLLNTVFNYLSFNVGTTNCTTVYRKTKIYLDTFPHIFAIFSCWTIYVFRREVSNNTLNINNILSTGSTLFKTYTI